MARPDQRRHPFGPAGRAGSGRRTPVRRYALAHGCPLLRRARCERFVGEHGAATSRASRKRGIDGGRDRPARSRRPRTSSGVPDDRPGPGGRPTARRSPSVASRTAAGSRASRPPRPEPTTPALVCFSYPLHPPGRPDQARGADEPLAGDPLPGPAAVGRGGPVRPDRAAARPPSRSSATPSSSRIRASATR